MVRRMVRMLYLRFLARRVPSGIDVRKARRFPEPMRLTRVRISVRENLAAWPGAG